MNSWQVIFQKLPSGDVNPYIDVIFAKYNLSTYNKQFTSDIIIKKIETKQFTSDITTVNRLTKQFISDIIIKKIETKQLTSDIITLSKTFTVDTILLQYTSYGKPYLYKSSDYCSANIYLEVYMRAASGTIYAKLIDELDNGVVGSTLITNDEILQGLISPVLILEDGKTYRVQFSSNGFGRISGANLLFINK